MANETEQVVEQQTDEQRQQTQQSSTQTQNGDQPGRQQSQQQQEDRSTWIPPHRFKEVNTGYQTEKQRAASLEQQLQQATQKIQALAGVQQVSPGELEMEEVRSALYKLVPGLQHLSDEMIQKLVRLSESGDQLEETNRTIWRNHGTKMLTSARDMVSDKLNVDTLTDRQRRRIDHEYVMYIEEMGQPGLARHEAGDQTLVEEFVTAFLNDWQESIRKSVVTQEAGIRRPVPSGRGRSTPVGGRKPINHSDPKAFGDAAVQSFLDHGGSFGER